MMGRKRSGIRRAPVALAVLATLLLVPLFGLTRDDSGDEREGWYSEEQAERGRTSYLENCSRCHSRDLNARSTYISLYRYPALTGAYFMDRWEGESVRTIYQVIRHTMPLDAPGTLDADTYADIVAYILQANGFPSGGRELPPERRDPERLRGLVIEAAAMVDRAQPQRPRGAVLEQSEGAAEPAALPAEEQPEPEQPTPPPPAAEDLPQQGAWYSEAQALRGDELFIENCARCHGRALQGVGVAPSLAGANFIARWEGKPVAEIFRIASTLMPLDGPGELDAQSYADLVAFILSENGFPAGDSALPPDQERLKEFVVTPELAEVPEVP